MNGDGILELYAQSYEYAKEHGELKLFLSSNEENIKCKWDIKASAEFYVDTDRVDVFLQDIASKYGAERTLYVLSRTVQKYGEINLPNGDTISERQDIGDGDGGVIDFCRSISSLQVYVPLLEAQRDLDLDNERDNANISEQIVIEGGSAYSTKNTVEEQSSAILAFKEYAITQLTYYNVDVREAFITGNKQEFNSLAYNYLDNLMADVVLGTTEIEDCDRAEITKLYADMYEDFQVRNDLYDEIIENAYAAHTKNNVARQFAKENNIPFDEYPYDPDDEFDPYAYDPNRMSLEDYERWHKNNRLHKAFEAVKAEYALSDKANEFLDRTETQMIVNDYQSLDPQMFKLAVFAQNYGTVSRIDEKLFDGKFKEVMKKINSLLSENAVMDIGDEADEDNDSEYQLKVGDEIELDDGKFAVTQIKDTDEGRKYELQDLNLTGWYPIFRVLSEDELYEHGFALVSSAEIEGDKGQIETVAGKDDVNPIPTDTNSEEIAEKELPKNYHFAEDFAYQSGAKTKYAINVSAIKTLKRLEAEHRNATPEEQDILAQYSGWGGIADAFDGNKENWSNHYTAVTV